MNDLHLLIQRPKNRKCSPHSTNNDSWERISNTLNKSSTSEYFRKWVGKSKETCKIRINSIGKLYFLFVNSSSEFEVQKSEAIVNVVFDFNEKDIGISVTYKKSTVRCYIERLNYNADKYYLYKSKGGIRDYLHCVNKTRKLEWGEGSNDDATLLVFDFSATTHTGTGNALKLRMIQSYLQTQLYYSFSENTAASGQSLSLKAYLHYIWSHQ